MLNDAYPSLVWACLRRCYHTATSSVGEQSRLEITWNKATKFHATTPIDGCGQAVRAFRVAPMKVPVAIAEPRLASSPLTAPVGYSGALVVERGDCSFTSKVKRAKDAGATVVIIVNDESDAPPSLVGPAEGDKDYTDIASVDDMIVFMVERNVGDELVAAITAKVAETVTIRRKLRACK